MLNRHNKDNVLLANKYQFNQWLDHKNVIDNTELNTQLNLLIKRFKNNHKWILVICNNATAQIHIHQQTGANSNNVLWVHANKVNVSLAKIKQTLAKGNCAAIALCDVEIKASQIAEIESAAVDGNTHCVLLNKQCHRH